MSPAPHDRKNLGETLAGIPETLANIPENIVELKDDLIHLGDDLRTIAKPHKPIGGLRIAAVNGAKELWAHKVRSLLSMSGIILGVAALAAMLSVVQGMIGGFRVFVEAQGGIERINIVQADLPKEQEHLAELSDGLTLRDAKAIRAAVPLIRHVAPEVNIGRQARIVHGGDQINSPVIGCTPEWLAVNKRRITRGRFISDLDSVSHSSVCVVGATVADALFPENESPVGQIVKVNGARFRIVGVLDRFDPEGAGESARHEPKSRQNRQSGFIRWKNQNVLIPMQTAMGRFTGNEKLTSLSVFVRDGDAVPEIRTQLENLMLQTHNGLLDFRVDTNEEILANFRRTEAAFTLSMGGVAAISILVGGVGIMNVMLASINERTREIGVRMALGARSRDVFLQFLAESAVIGALGGLMGLALSYALVGGMAKLLAGAIPGAAPISISPGTLLIGLGFSSVIGLTAGVYPALRASRLNPIEALRSE